MPILSTAEARRETVIDSSIVVFAETGYLGDADRGCG